MKAQLIVLPSTSDLTLTPVSSSKIQGICSDGCWCYEEAALSSLTGEHHAQSIHKSAVKQPSGLYSHPDTWETPQNPDSALYLNVWQVCPQEREAWNVSGIHNHLFVGLGASARIFAIFCWHGPTFESNPWYLIKNSIWSICLQKQSECIQIMSTLQHVVRPCILLFRAFLELNSL